MDGSFKNRQQAGLELAGKLAKYKTKNPIVLALPRGGVVVGYVIAKQLEAPLKVVIVRKIGAPDNREFGIGAIGENGVVVLDEKTLGRIDISPRALGGVMQEEQIELERRVALYRNNRSLPDLKNKTAILVDDGLATGVTAKAAIAVVRKLNPKKVIFAAPVCVYDTSESLRSLVGEIICLETPINLVSIGSWYEDFDQVTDEEVVRLLRKSTTHGG